MNPTASTTPSTSSSSSTTENETSTSSTTNDNSNPQQGTGAATSSTSANTNNSTKTTTTTSCGTGRSTKTEVTPEKLSLTTETTAQPQANDEGVISKDEEVSKVGTADDTEKCHFKIPPFKRDSRKLFVGGLPPDVTDKEFKEFFSQYGTILDSIVMIDRDTKCSRGFGFVTFENPSIALEIITNNKSTRRENNSGKNMNRSEVCINGKWCEVKASEPKRVTNVNNNNGHNGHYYYSRSGSVPHQQNGGTTGAGTGGVPSKESSSAAVAGTSATLTTGTSTTLEDVEDVDVPAEVVHYNHYYMMNNPNPYMYQPYPHHHVTTPTPPSNPYVTGYVPTQPSPLPHPAYAPSMGGGYYYHPHPSSYPTPTGAAGMIPPPQQQQQYPQPGLQGEWMYDNDYYYHDYNNNMMYVDGGIGDEGGDGTYYK